MLSSLGGSSVDDDDDDDRKKGCEVLLAPAPLCSSKSSNRNLLVISSILFRSLRSLLLNADVPSSEEDEDMSLISNCPGVTAVPAVGI